MSAAAVLGSSLTSLWRATGAKEKIRHGSCLVKAERLCDIVNGLLDSEADDQGAVLHAKLATLNNLSLLQRERSNCESAQKRLRAFAWTISLAPSSSMTSFSQINVDVMLLSIPLASSAPSIAPAA